jgi:hypothetical protein
MRGGNFWCKNEDLVVLKGMGYYHVGLNVFNWYAHCPAILPRAPTLYCGCRIQQFGQSAYFSELPKLFWGKEAVRVIFTCGSVTARYIINYVFRAVRASGFAPVFFITPRYNVVL